jgi:hypothetical protein
MNTNGQTAVGIELNPVTPGREPPDTSSNLMKSWLDAVNSRQMPARGTPAAPTPTGNGTALASLPEALQQQFLQERLRLTGDRDGTPNADAEFAPTGDGNAVAEGDSLTERIARHQSSDEDTAGDNAARTEVSERGARNAAGEAGAEGELAVNESSDDEELSINEEEGEGAEDGALVLTTQAQSLVSGSNTEIESKPSSLRDATDYKWIEKFSERMLLEVESRAADRNVAIQLSNDLIPNAVLTLSRLNGRWQLDADTADEHAAESIENAEQALAARFAARGLGEIEINVSRDRLYADV